MAYTVSNTKIYLFINMQAKDIFHKIPDPIYSVYEYNVRNVTDLEILNETRHTCSIYEPTLI